MRRITCCTSENVKLRDAAAILEKYLIRGIFTGGGGSVWRVGYPYHLSWGRCGNHMMEGGVGGIWGQVSEQFLSPKKLLFDENCLSAFCYQLSYL